MDEMMIAAIESVIKRRKTEKVLCDVGASRPVPTDVTDRNRETVLHAIETAGWAPFHYPRKVSGIAEPWRAHVLWHEDAQKTAVHLRDALKDSSKVPRLMAACSALVLVTWLPEFYDPDSQNQSKLPLEAQRARDEEHLAAASAMVQNLLLMLTAHGMGTYWSSGGILREKVMFDYLGIPGNERLLAAVFVEYAEMMNDLKERTSGSQRNNRSGAWIREVSVD